MSQGNSQEKRIGENLSDDDQNVLRLWRESLSLLDMRYHGKALLMLVARAMADDEFRSRLVNDTDAVLSEFEPGLPDGLQARFLDNTPTTVNVVLPPRAGEMEKRPKALRDALRSRTAENAVELFQDDLDFGNFANATKDTVIFGPEPKK